MSKLRLDHAGIVVDDIAAAVRFFEALGLEVEGRAQVGGEWVDRLCGLEGTICNIVMMRTPDGAGRVELAQYESPKPAPNLQTRVPVNAPGLRSMMFAVDDLDTTVTRLQEVGGQLIGEIVNFQDQYLLAYIDGPAGTIIALAQNLQS